MVFAVLLTFFIGATTGAVLDHEYPQIGKTLTTERH